MERLGQLSIAIQLPLISALLVVVIGTFTWSSYREVRRSARAAASEQLERVTTQLRDHLRNGLKPIDPAAFFEAVNAIGQFWLKIVTLP